MGPLTKVNIMKAYIKATGKTVDVKEFADGVYVSTYNNDVYLEENLDFWRNASSNLDYWTCLKHQYAGMAMQGMLNNSLLITGLLKVNKSHEDIVAEVTGTAIRYAHALVEKMKEERK